MFVNPLTALSFSTVSGDETHWQSTWQLKNAYEMRENLISSISNTLLQRSDASAICFKELERHFGK